MGDMTLGELRNATHGEVLSDTDALDRASVDASLFSVRPRAVVAPKDAGDLGNLVRFVSEKRNAGEHLSLTARSGGTGMDGGALSDSLVLDFTKHFTRIGEVATDDTLAGQSGFGVVEPGAFYRDFEKATLAKNLLMPSYPASRELCTVGGMVANNAGGEKTLRYGKTADYVRRLKVVLADGNEYALEPLTRGTLKKKVSQKNFEGLVYAKTLALCETHDVLIQSHRPKVSKNSAGYALWNIWNAERDVFDLTRLFTGSQGTLGLITEITFGLVGPEPHSRMVVVFLDSFDRLGELVQAVLAHKPTTFESYDDKTLRLALKFFPEFLKRLKVNNIAALATGGIPEALSILFRGVPKFVLQITFEGDDPRALDEQTRAVAESLREFRPRLVSRVSPDEEYAYLLIRRESFNLLRQKVQGLKTTPFIDDIVVPPETLPEFLPRLEHILVRYDRLFTRTLQGHIGNGNFHIIPLANLADPAVREAIPTLSREVYDLVLEYGGSITGEHNDGMIRTPFLKQQFGAEMIALFAEVKDIFDPLGIFNPGKKVPATGSKLDEVLSHLKKG